MSHTHMTGGGSVTFFSKALAALFPFAGTWSPSASVLIGIILLSIFSSYGISALFERHQRAMTIMTFLLMLAAGTYSNAICENSDLGQAGGILRGLVLAVPGQLVMAYLLFLVFGYRPSRDEPS